MFSLLFAAPSMTDEEELALALDGRTQAARDREAASKAPADTRTKTQRHRDARQAVLPAVQPGSVADASIASSAPASRDGERPMSPPAIVTDGKRRNPTNRNVAFTGSEGSVAPVSIEMKPVDDDTSAGLPAAAAKGYIPGVPIYHMHG